MNSEFIVQINKMIPHRTYIPPKMKLEEIDDEGIMAGSPIQTEVGGTEEGEYGEDGNDPMSKEGFLFYDFSDESEESGY